MVAIANQYGFGQYGIDGCSHSFVAPRCDSISAIRSSCCVTCGGTQWPPAAEATPDPTTAATPHPTTEGCVTTSHLAFNPASRRRHVVTECPVGEFVICEGETFVQIDAFRDCSEITKATIPSTVTSIDFGSFIRSSVEEIVFSEHITSIGEHAFRECPNLKEVVFPSSLTTLEAYAFYETFLEKATFNENLAVIGQLAFRSNSLHEVDLPDSLVEVGSNAFIGSPNLENITIRSDFKAGAGVFSVCSKLTKATFTSNAKFVNDLGLKDTGLQEVVLDSVERVGPRAFQDCETLSQVAMSGRVQRIDTGAFQNCPSLKSVLLTENVTRIDDDAFQDCTSLENVTIRGTVKTVGADIFTNTNLSWVVFEPPASIFSNFNLGECCANAQVVLADTIVEIGEGAFRNMNLREVNLPSSVTAIETSAFQDCTELAQVRLPDNLATIGASAFQGCTSLTKVSLPDSVSTIGQSAFQGCNHVTQVATGGSVVEIGPSAFKGCFSLMEVMFGECLSTIGSYAFQGCVKLEHLSVYGQMAGDEASARRLVAPAQAKFGGSLEKIGEGAFQNTSLTSLHIPPSVRVIQRLAFSHIPQLASVEIEGTSDSFEEVGAGIFAESCSIEKVSINVSNDLEPKVVMPLCANITTVTVTSGRISTKWLSSNCKQLLSLEVHSDSVPAGAWQGCTSLERTYFGGAVAWIGAEAFRGCSALAAVQFANHSSLEFVGDHAFRDCTALPNIRIPSGTTELGKGVFQDCSSLQLVSIHGPVKTIREDLFKSCANLVRVSLPDTLSSVGESAFDGCAALDNILLPRNVSYIADYGFRGCVSLRTLQLPADAIISRDAFDFAATMDISVAGAEAGFSPPWSTASFATDIGCRKTYTPRVARDSRTLSCQCPAGWLYNHDSRECEECRTHLDCEGGHSQADADRGIIDTGVTVAPGYMTLTSDPFSVYSCVKKENDQRCQGARAVASDEMCLLSSDPTKARCAVCRDGFVKGGARQCLSCAEESALIPALKAILAFALQFLLFARVYYDSIRKSRPRHAIISATVEFIQVAQVILRMDVRFTDQFLAIKEVFEFFTVSRIFERFEFKSACFVGEAPIVSIVAQALTPLLLLVNLPILYLLLRSRGRRMTFDQAHNLIGVFVSALFLTLIALSLSLFYTESMPNGKVMVKEFSELEYGSPEWREALPINLVATAVYCVPLISYVAYAVWRAPRLAATSPGFLVRFEFCFDGVRPDRWWWILFKLSLGLVLTSAQVLLPDNVRSQIYLTLLGCFAFLIAEYTCWPGEFEDGNSASTAFKQAVIMTLVVITSFPLSTDDFDKREKEVSETWSWIAILFISYACLNAAVRYVRDVLKSFKPHGSEETEAQQTFWRFRDIATCMLLMPEQELAKRVKEYTQYDNRNLEIASHTLVNLIFDSQISGRWRQQRVMACPQKVWDHHAQVAELLKSHRAGRVVKEVNERFELREQIIKLASAMYNNHRKKEKQSKLVRSFTSAAGLESSVTLVGEMVRATTQNSLSTAWSGKAKEPLKDRLKRVMGLNQPDEMTRSDFQGLLFQLSTDMSTSDADRLWAMLDPDECGSVPMPDLTHLLSIMAPKKLVQRLPRTNSQDSNESASSFLEFNNRDVEELTMELGVSTAPSLSVVSAAPENDTVNRTFSSAFGEGDFISKLRSESLSI